MFRLSQFKTIITAASIPSPVSCGWYGNFMSLRWLSEAIIQISTFDSGCVCPLDPSQNHISVLKIKPEDVLDLSYASASFAWRYIRKRTQFLFCGYSIRGTFLTICLRCVLSMFFVDISRPEYPLYIISIVVYSSQVQNHQIKYCPEWIHTQCSSFSKYLLYSGSPSQCLFPKTSIQQFYRRVTCIQVIVIRSFSLCGTIKANLQ